MTGEILAEIEFHPEDGGEDAMTIGDVIEDEDGEWTITEIEETTYFDEDGEEVEVEEVVWYDFEPYEVV